MQDLDTLRGQLLGIRAQTDAALQAVDGLIAAVRKMEAEATKQQEQEAHPRVRFLGDTPNDGA